MTAPARFKDLCLDANDHHALADWWCAALGYVRRDEVEPPEDGWTRPADWPVPIVDPSGAGPLMWIVPVPESKVSKNRMHLDVVGDTQALLAAGATMLRPRDPVPLGPLLLGSRGRRSAGHGPHRRPSRLTASGPVDRLGVVPRDVLDQVLNGCRPAVRVGGHLDAAAVRHRRAVEQDEPPALVEDAERVRDPARCGVRTALASEAFHDDFPHPRLDGGGDHPSDARGG